MSIDEAYRTVAYICNKEQNGQISADQFNLLCVQAQLSVINNRLLAKYDEKGMLVKGFGVNDKIREELRPLLKNPQTISVTTGVASYPVDYLYVDVMMTSGGRIITEATPDEISILNQSQVKPPSTTYPKYVIHQDGFNVYPTSLTSIKLAYLRKPITPFRNYTNTNDRDVYNASGSQDFELSILTHLEVVHQLLMGIGVNLAMDKVVAYAAAMKETGA